MQRDLASEFKLKDPVVRLVRIQAQDWPGLESASPPGSWTAETHCREDTAEFKPPMDDSVLFALKTPVVKLYRLEEEGCRHFVLN